MGRIRGEYSKGTVHGLYPFGELRMRPDIYGRILGWGGIFEGLAVSKGGGVGCINAYPGVINEDVSSGD